MSRDGRASRSKQIQADEQDQGHWVTGSKITRKSTERSRDELGVAVLSDERGILNGDHYNTLRTQLEQRAESSRINYNLDLINLELQTKVAEENSKQVEILHDLVYSMPTELEINLVQMHSAANSAKMETETSAISFGMKEVGLAKLEFRTSERLAEARGLRKVADAVKHYYKALVLDRLAGSILVAIAKRFGFDPEFKFRLHRPLSRPPLKENSIEK